MMILTIKIYYVLKDKNFSGIVEVFYVQVFICSGMYKSFMQMIQKYDISATAVNFIK